MQWYFIGIAALVFYPLIANAAADGLRQYEYEKDQQRRQAEWDRIDKWTNRVTDPSIVRERPTGELWGGLPR